MNDPNLAVVKSKIGFNERPWLANPYIVKFGRSTMGALYGYTSLAPMQFGSTKEIAFFLTLQAKGATMLPTGRKFAFEWEAGTTSSIEEGELIFDGSVMEILQISKTRNNVFDSSAPIDKHYYDIADDATVTLANNAESSVNFDYWRVFAEHSSVSLG